MEGGGFVTGVAALGGQSTGCSPELAEPAAVGEVSRIIFHQLRHELGIASGQRHIDLTSGHIFGEVTRGRQAPIEREGLRRARLVPGLVEQIA